jgi:hypothetical protein
MWRRALQGNQETLGPKHPKTLNSVNNLGMLLQAQGKLGEAEPLYRRALQGSEETLGPKHQDTLNTRGNLGSLLMVKPSSSDKDAGREMVTGVLGLLRGEHSLPPTHRWVVKFEKALTNS